MTDYATRWEWMAAQGLRWAAATDALCLLMAVDTSATFTNITTFEALRVSRLQ